MDKNMKISVIMSVYNCEDTLTMAIDSIIDQTYENWEFIICNDCSTDSTQEILDNYALRFPKRFVLLRNEKNMRLAYSLNRCLEQVTGAYIARMDGDDYCAPDRFEKQIRFLTEHPEYDLVGTAMRRFNDKGYADAVIKPENVDKYFLRKDVTFNHATILARRYVFDKLNGYVVSKRTERGQDYDLWFRFFAEGFNGCNLQEPLYFVREDMNAIRRRTFRTRWYAYQTTKVGFKLLGFPKRWLVKPFVTMICKSLTPYWIVSLYREYQKNKG